MVSFDTIVGGGESQTPGWEPWGLLEGPLGERRAACLGIPAPSGIRSLGKPNTYFTSECLPFP